MKRLLLGLLMMTAMAACGSPLAKQETPQQALAVAAQRSSQLKSAQFDFDGSVNMNFPPALAQMFGQSSASSGSLSVTLTGSGKAQFPDRYQASVNAKMSGLAINTEVIVANGKAYVKNPLTNKWEASKQSASITDQFGQPDPLSYDQLLKNVKSIKDLGDTTLNGTGVHHYQLTPDKAKLQVALEASAAKNPQAQAALKQVLNSGSMTVQVWFGKDDHLVRRLATDADYSIDLNQLMGSLGSTAGSAGRLPAGSTVHAVAHMVINFHDFDSAVTISVPSVG